MFPRFTPKPGEYYLVVTCERCKSKLLAASGLNKEMADLKGTYSAICPVCSHAGRYRLESYQQPKESVSGTPVIFIAD